MAESPSKLLSSPTSSSVITHFSLEMTRIPKTIRSEDDILTHFRKTNFAPIKIALFQDRPPGWPKPSLGDENYHMAILTFENKEKAMEALKKFSGSTLFGPNTANILISFNRELLHQTCYRLCIERIPNPYRLQLTSYDFFNAYKQFGTVIGVEVRNNGRFDYVDIFFQRWTECNNASKFTVRELGEALRFLNIERHFKGTEMRVYEPAISRTKSSSSSSIAVSSKNVVSPTPPGLSSSSSSKTAVPFSGSKWRPSKSSSHQPKTISSRAVAETAHPSRNSSSYNQDDMSLENFVSSAYDDRNKKISLANKPVMRLDDGFEIFDDRSAIRSNSMSSLSRSGDADKSGSSSSRRKQKPPVKKGSKKSAIDEFYESASEEEENYKDDKGETKDDVTKSTVTVPTKAYETLIPNNIYSDLVPSRLEKKTAEQRRAALNYHMIYNHSTSKFSPSLLTFGGADVVTGETKMYVIEGNDQKTLSQWNLKLGDPSHRANFDSVLEALRGGAGWERSKNMWSVTSLQRNSAITALECWDGHHNPTNDKDVLAFADKSGKIGVFLKGHSLSQMEEFPLTIPMSSERSKYIRNISSFEMDNGMIVVGIGGKEVAIFDVRSFSERVKLKPTMIHIPSTDEKGKLLETFRHRTDSLMATTFFGSSTSQTLLTTNVSKSLTIRDLRSPSNCQYNRLRFPVATMHSSPMFDPHMILMGSAQDDRIAITDLRYPSSPVRILDNIHSPTSKPLNYDTNRTISISKVRWNPHRRHIWASVCSPTLLDVHAHEDMLLDFMNTESLGAGVVIVNESLVNSHPPFSSKHDISSTETKTRTFLNQGIIFRHFNQSTCSDMSWSPHEEHQGILATTSSSSVGSLNVWRSNAFVMFRNSKDFDTFLPQSLVLRTDVMGRPNANAGNSRAYLSKTDIDEVTNSWLNVLKYKEIGGEMGTVFTR